MPNVIDLVKDKNAVELKQEIYNRLEAEVKNQLASEIEVVKQDQFKFTSQEA